ncbi:T6SS effector amidase Tae4 family protein [Massilia sp. W12]|uniref:T6SS effector amidase Tae4 family protein n=1 Tax=Massilia sp. W12 TaxID=3126507 RepID=UPI0030D1D2F8
MKLSYFSLKKYHYSSDKFSLAYVSGADLYHEIGYVQDDLIKQNAGYVNTCATRMSLALLKHGAPINGRLKVRVGKFKGRTVEPGAKLLADQLAKPDFLGKPQIYRTIEAPGKLVGKRGIVFFWKIEGYSGGHIDLIEPSNAAQVCHSACYFSAKEVWFWPLR